LLSLCALAAAGYFLFRPQTPPPPAPAEDRAANRFEAYRAKLADAQKELRRGEAARAEELLNACDSDQRAWEWFHLLRLCREAPATVILGPPQERPARLILAADGQRVAVHTNPGRAGGSLRVVDLATGGTTAELPFGDLEVSFAALSPDGRRVVLGNPDEQTTQVERGWRELPAPRNPWQPFQPVRPFDPFRPPTARDFLPRRDLMFGRPGSGVFVEELRTVPVTVSGGRLGLDLLTGAPLLEGEPGVTAGAFSGDGAQLLVAGSGGVQRVDVSAPGAAAREVATVRSAAVAFAPDGRLAVGVDGAIRLYPADGGDFVLREVRFGGAGIVPKWVDGKVMVEKVLPGGAAVGILKNGDELVSVTGPDGRTHPVSEMTGLGEFMRWARGPAGTTVAFEMRDQGQPGVFSRSVTRRELAPLSITRIAFSPDGRWMAGLAGGSAAVWDLTADRPPVVCQGDFTALTFAPDGRRLVAGQENGAAAVIDPTTGERVCDLVGLLDVLADLTFNRAGELVAAGRAGNLLTCKTWDSLLPADRPVRADARRDSEQALRALDAAILAQPGSGPLYYERGLLHAELGNFEQARNDLAEWKRLGSGKPGVPEPAYYPLKQGNTWTYKAGERTVVVTVAAAETVGGKAGWRVETRDGTTVTSEVLFGDATGLYRLKVKDDELRPPVKVLPSPVPAPSSPAASWAGRHRVGGAEFVVSSRVVSRERVRTPAGEFETVVLEAIGEVSGAGTLTTRMWLTPGVGPVKLAFVWAGDGQVFELVRFEEGK
jgi:hypothetical protein